MAKYLLLLLLLVPSVSHGATYYIDYLLGSDSNNGTSTGTAFKHVPGDDSATATAASTTLVGGDTVILKGSTSYTGSIDLDWSGSSGSPITYDGNSAGTFGTGKAILFNSNSDDADLSTGFNDTDGAVSWVDIKNIIFTEIGGWTDAILATRDETDCQDTTRPGSGIRLGAGSTNINITDNEFYEIGFWDNHKSNDWATFGGAGVQLINADSVLVEGNDFQRTKVGIILQSSSSGSSINNIEITNNTGGDFLDWWADISAASTHTTRSNINIHHNTISDQNDWRNEGSAVTNGGDTYTCILDHTSGTDSDEPGVGANWETYWVLDNTFGARNGAWSGASASYQDGDMTDGYAARWKGCNDNPHLDGFFLRNDYANSTFSNIVFHSNTFTDNGGGTANIYISRGGSATIYNNVFENTSHSNGAIYVDNGSTSVNPYPQEVRVLNNSFRGSSRLIKFGNAGGMTNDSIDYWIYNNSFLDTRSSANSGGTINLLTTPSGLDYNQHETDAIGNNMFYYLGAYRTFTYVQGLGWETNGQEGDPLYTSSTNLYPQDISPLRGSGSDQSATFTTDISGTTRSSWDIGAYEYVSTSNSTSFGGSVTGSTSIGGGATGSLSFE